MKCPVRMYSDDQKSADHPIGVITLLRQLIPSVHILPGRVACGTLVVLLGLLAGPLLSAPSAAAVSSWHALRPPSGPPFLYRTAPLFKFKYSYGNLDFGYAPGVPVLFDISCPSVSTCYAVGKTAGNHGTILSTTDSGAIWKMQHIPSGTGTLLSISCPSVSTCYAVGSRAGNFILSRAGSHGTILSTTDSGVIWKMQKILPATVLVPSVTCPSSKVCFAGAYTNGKSWNNNPPTTLLALTDHGTTWKVSNFPPAIMISEAMFVYPSLTTLACASTKVCYVLGIHTARRSDGRLFFYTLFYYTNNSGVTWKIKRVPGYVGQSIDMSCPSPNICYALSIDGFLVRTTDSGTIWNKTGLPSHLYTYQGVHSIACPSSSTCYAAGSTCLTSSSCGVVEKPPITSTTDSGKTWQFDGMKGVSPGTVILGISCPTVADCYAVGANQHGVVILSNHPTPYISPTGNIGLWLWILLGALVALTGTVAFFRFHRRAMHHDI
jgi:hypothetical protein